MYQGRMAPVYHQPGYGAYMQPSVSHYAPNVEDVRYDRLEAPRMHQEPPSVIGMPTMDAGGLLGMESEAVGIGMVDPRLGGPNYEVQPGYGAPPSEAYHPGQATLTDGWAQEGHVGAAFDQEFANFY